MSAETFGRGRRFAIGANVLVMIVLAIAAAVLVVFVTGFTDLRRRFDLTQAHDYSLAPETVRILESLEKDVEITTVFDGATVPWDVHGEVARAIEYTRDVLQEYKVRAGRRMFVEHLDPKIDGARVRELVQELGLRTYNIVIVRCGTRRRVLGLQSDLAEFDNLQPQPMQQPVILKGFRAEEAISSALYEVLQERQPKVYVSVGHQEMSIEAGGPNDAALLAQSLTRDNVDVRPISLLTAREVPADADAVLILAPRQAYAEPERAALDAYLRRGGRLLVLLDPAGDKSLDPLLAAVGVEVDRAIVCKEWPAQLKGAEPDVHLIGQRAPGSFGAHPITASLDDANAIVSLAGSGSVRPLPQAAGEFTSLLNSHPDAFADALQPDGKPGDHAFDQRVDGKRGQRTLAAAIEPTGDYAKSRLVVIPSSQLAGNKPLAELPGNDLFLRRVVAWLINKKEFVQLPPRRPHTAAADLRPQEYDELFRYVVIFMPVGAVLLAAAIAFVRRR